MINLVFLVIFHKLRTLIFFLIIVLGFSWELYAQSDINDRASDTGISLFQKDSLVELTKGNVQVQVPVGKGIAIEFKIRGWTFQVLKSQTDQQFGFINLASIGDKDDGIVFYFYKLEKGQDILNFQRYDEANNILYTYLLTINWNEALSSKKNVLHEDKTAKIYILEDISALQGVQQSTPKAMSDSQDMSLSSASSPMNSETRIETPTESSKPSQTSTEAATPLPRVIDTNSNQEEFIDDVIESPRATFSSEDMMPEQNMAQDPDLLETSVQDIPTMSYEDIIDYIEKEWSNVEYETMMKNIDMWITNHSNMFQSSHILWVYLNQLRTKIDEAIDVERVVNLCKKIISEYPLGYEYFDAKLLYQKLKFEYMYTE